MVLPFDMHGLHVHFSYHKVVSARAIVVKKLPLDALDRINIKGLFIDPGIYTSMKTRIIAQHQQVVRVDREKAVDSDNDTLNQRIWLFIERHISSFDAVIISDYGKGVISSALVRRVCTLAKRKKKIITVDPKVEHFEYYDKVTAITPNKKEVENAIRDIKVRGKRMLPINSDKLMTNKDIDRAGKELLKFLELDSLLITLGEHGMRLFENGKKPVSIKTSVREVYDVSGAGDTVIAVFTLSLTAGATKFQASDLANYAAGIVVGKIGAVSISKDELILAIRGGS